MKPEKNNLTLPFTQITRTVSETEKLAENFSKQLSPNGILLLIGDLGAGKTAFVRGLAKGLKISDPSKIHSPTFTLINEYAGKTPLFHVDLYRLNSKTEIENLGLEDYFDRNGIIAIEWADRAINYWPKDAIEVRFELISLNERKISMNNYSPS